MAALTLWQAAGLVIAWWILLKLYNTFLRSSPLDKLPGPPSPSWVSGNLGQFMDRQGWAWHDSLNEKYGHVMKMHDMFGSRSMIVTDPKAVHQILIKDQDIYEEADWFIQWNRVIFGMGLISTLGAHHRKQRKLLNPVFSANHMRYMTPIFYRVSARLGDAISARLTANNGKTEVDMFHWMARTALELIGQGGLGYSFDPLTSDRHDVLGDALRNFMPSISRFTVIQIFAAYYIHIGTSSFRRKFIDLLPFQSVQDVKNIIDTMDRESRRIFKSKKEALLKGDEAVAHQVGEGKDLLSVMLRANMESSAEERLDEEELIGQMNTLLFAATDTTSNTLARILHQFALHQDVQQKLRAELIEAFEDGDVPYDRLMELPYLDAVCKETLRVYAPAMFLQREARKDVVLPVSRPVHANDGTELTEILVPKNTAIFVPLRQCNINPEIWGEDAKEWKPERWLSSMSETKERYPGIYANMMTFAAGGRACIGFRFSLLEMKVVLSTLVRRFKFSLSDKEIYWNLAGVCYPTTSLESIDTKLPLTVEAI